MCHIHHKYVYTHLFKYADIPSCLSASWTLPALASVSGMYL